MTPLTVIWGWCPLVFLKGDSDSKGGGFITIGDYNH